MARMRGLYPIVDLDTLAKRGVSPLALAKAVLTARPALLQLRAKRQAPREVLGWLRELEPLCRAAGTLLFANDRPDLALISGCDGVHVGQDDVPVAEVRRLSATLRIGVSTHDERQLELALAERPDYVAFGPIFSTVSKEGAAPELGLVRLARAAELARAAGVPLVAIGGLTLASARQLGELGVVAAVISDLLLDGLDAVSARASAFQAALSV
jgi:thiamine-phosphate pyrophosphorylase